MLSKKNLQMKELRSQYCQAYSQALAKGKENSATFKKATTGENKIQVMSY